MEILQIWIQTVAKSAIQTQAVARQDQSLHKLRQLLDRGYTTVTWRAVSAVDYLCNELDGQQWMLSDFLAGTAHEAPIFSHSHVNCHCILEISGPNLPNVHVDSY